MLLSAGILVLAAILGVAAGVGSTCGIGLSIGTSTWCSPLAWFVGSLIAVPASLLGGLPLWLLFQRLGFRHHWQFVLGGTLCALPVWYLLASPFEPERWYHAGGFDSLNYLGSGAFGGYFFWVLSRLPRGNAL
jgi:hypothetical protein